MACYQAINTLLYIPRIIQGYTEADLTPVTDKACIIDPELLKEFDTYVYNTLREHQFDSSKVLNLNSLTYKVNKKGPNGKPKLETADDEAFALHQSKLWHPFKRLAANLGIPYLSEYVEQIAVRRNVQLGSMASAKLATTKIRVLAFVPDSEFKTRIVAIPDFWTQLVLEPFRAHVNMVIQRLFSAYDFVEDQDLGFETLQRVQKELSDEEKKYLFSFDFSDWTTRYHRDLQKVTVRNLFSGPISEAWAQLVVHCDWVIPKLKTSVKFGQGQGMGTNGSFPVATLTDHLFIHFIYMKCKERPNYGKIGDDLWILDPQNMFPSYYEKINLPINFGKTKRYSEHLNVPISEFASRVVIDGIDVSRLSPNVVNQSQDWKSIPTLLAVAQKRNIAIRPSHLPVLQHKLKGQEVTYFEKLEEVLYSLSWLKESVLNLDRDYLKSNGWLTERFSFLSQPEKQVKFQLSFAILQIVRNHCLVEDKAKEVFDIVKRHTLDEIRQLGVDDSPIWDRRSSLHQLALGIIPGSEGEEILSPKQVIALNRYKIQWELITTKLSDLHDLDGDTPEDIIVFAEGLQDIANRSNFDNGVIAYDTKTWKNTVFSVIQVLRRLDLEKDELWFQNQHELDLINSIIDTDYLPRSVSDLLPTCRVLPGPS
jgi:hypothetical protein